MAQPGTVRRFVPPLRKTIEVLYAGIDIGVPGQPTHTSILSTYSEHAHPGQA